MQVRAASYGHTLGGAVGLFMIEARGLPMLCANPDIHVTLPTGQRGHMPGLVARLYEELGGAVT